uniref:CCHC-type domain-containing protein n=2 Tax=Oryza sativa subsp. japonica TaxID=39947 RepID=A0A5S6RBS4_ORYSJ|nr:Hypothetical protein [Oryza sativa Japonica Group]AAM08725.1 Hypothetical protein [Oryza sativa Japonica Group]AAP51914.1 retrotransposon protein, putative, unclassified [Oryza sativa Japonica Group]
MANNEKGNKVRSQDIGTSSSRVNEAPDTSCVTLVQHLINQNRLLIEILQQHQTPILNLSQIQPQVQLEAVQALTPRVSMPPASRKTHGDVPHVDSKEASIICFMCDEQGHYARECPQQKRKTPMRTEDEVRKMIITSTEWPPPGMTKRQRRNTFRGAPQLTEHLLANGGRVFDSEDSDQVSSDDEDEMERMGHFADKCPKPRNIAAGPSVHATPCNQKLAPQRIVIHASRSSPIARVATAPTPASALPQGVNAQFQPQPSVDKTEASIGIVPLDVPAQQPRNQVQDEEPEPSAKNCRRWKKLFLDLLQAERRAINLRRAIPSRRPLFASTSNQKEASPVNDSNMQSYHIITEPIKDDAVTRTTPAISLQNQNEQPRLWFSVRYLSLGNRKFAAIM